MNRSFREIVELVLFGLIALLVVTGLFWLIGWAFTGIGIALKWLSGLLWLVLKFAIPVALVGALFYFLVRFIQKNQANPPAPAATVPEKVETVADNAKEAATETASEVAEAAKDVADTVQEQAKNVADKASDVASEAADRVAEVTESAKEAVEEAAVDAKEAAEEVAQDAQEAAENVAEETKKKK